MKLTDIKIRNLQPGTRPYKISDGSGLNLLVTPSGGRLWRLAYRYGGKQKEVAFGAYPAIPLRRARELRDKAKALLAEGQDPAEIRKQERRLARAREANTLESVGRAWYSAQLSRWSPRHQKEVLKKLENDVYPVLGRRPIGDIEPPELLSAIRKIEDRGALHLAKKTMRLCGQIFRYAVAHGLAARDPSQDLKGALKSAPPTRHLAALKAAELPTFLQALSRYDGDRSTVLTVSRSPCAS